MKKTLFSAVIIGALTAPTAMAADNAPAPPPGTGALGGIGGGLGGGNKPGGAMPGPRFEAMRERMQERSAEMFKKMDANADGKISQEEHAAFFKQRFAEVDANKDGFLTEDEIRTHRMKEMGERNERSPMDGSGMMQPMPGMGGGKEAGKPAGL